MIWSQHRATFLGYLALLLSIAAISAGVGLVVGRRRPVLRWPLGLLPLPVMVATYYFYALL